MVPLSDPRIAAVAIEECGEPLVDMRTSAPLLVDDRQADPEGAYAHLRSGVVDRLVTAQSLLPRGLRLLIVEGYRPLAVQERYFAEHHEHLRRSHPGWPVALLYEHRGNVTAVARAMGKAPAQIHRWMKRFLIDPDVYRAT